MAPADENLLGSGLAEAFMRIAAGSSAPRLPSLPMSIPSPFAVYSQVP